MTEARALTKSGVFDGAWYLHRYEDVAAAGKDPLQHFIEYGWAEGRRANHYFDPDWYRTTNPDVAAAKVDPLLHYVREGEREGRPPHPRFDAAWYRSAYEVPADRLAFGHFIANHLSNGSFLAPICSQYR